MSPKFIVLYSSACTVAKWYSSELKINVLKKGMGERSMKLELTEVESERKTQEQS